MATGVGMYKRIVATVLDSYGLDYAEVFDAQKGYRNESYPVLLKSGVTVNLLFYKREAGILGRIRRADEVSEFAFRSGLSVRTQADKRTMVLATPRSNVYCRLYHYLPGKTIAWEGFTKKHIKLLGWSMSDLHHSLSSLSVTWMRDVTIYDELDSLSQRMIAYWSDLSVQNAMLEKLHVILDLRQLEKLRKLVALCRHLPDQQVLHMDMVRGNVLFGDSHQGSLWTLDETTLTGIIDFEKTTYGHPLFDIARTIAFLLVDCQEKDPQKIYDYFLYSGYNKRGAATIRMRQEYNSHTYADLLEGLVRLFLLYDFYKFLRHTPYESLEQNHHYVRTRDILLGYAMIRYPLGPRGK